MFLIPRHPILRLCSISIAVRVTGLWLFYFGRDLYGNIQMSASMDLFLVGVCFHAGVLILAGLGLAFLERTIPALDRQLPWVALPFLMVTMLMGQVDLLYQHHLGGRLTLSVVRTYLGADLLSADILFPLYYDWGFSLFSLLLVVLGTLGLCLAARRPRGKPCQPLLTPFTGVYFLVLILLLSLPTALEHPFRRSMIKPLEVLWMEEWAFGGRTAPPLNESEVLAELRTHLPLGVPWQWAGPLFPLGRLARDSTPDNPSDPPDIILVVIESLRAADLGFILPPGGRSTTPHMDRLALESVVYQNFIANGYPTRAGFFAIHCSGWPHSRRVILADFSNTRFEALPLRLKGLGYHTLAMWGGNPSFENQLAWARRWYDQYEFTPSGNRFYNIRPLSDAQLLSRLTARIRTHDRLRKGQALFAYVATAGTHPPYTEAAFEARSHSDQPPLDIQQRYNRMLGQLDRHIGRLLVFLKQRPRWNNTIVLITGDHSNRTIEPVRGSLQSLPLDNFVWTGALLRGPPALVGPLPRRETFAASQVDIMPTLLALAGDRRPFNGLGTNLLADIDPARRSAVAVRPGGYRLDRNGHTLLVSAADPQDFWIWPAFGKPSEALPSAAPPPGAQEARQLHRMVDYWSYLVEQNRIKPPTDRHLNPPNIPIRELSRGPVPLAIGTDPHFSTHADDDISGLVQ